MADAHSLNDAAAWFFRQNVVALQADVLVVLRRHSMIGLEGVAHALIELTGSVCVAVAENEPPAKLTIDKKLGELAAFVATTGQRPQ